MPNYGNGNSFVVAYEIGYSDEVPIALPIIEGEGIRGFLSELLQAAAHGGVRGALQGFRREVLDISRRSDAGSRHFLEENTPPTSITVLYATGASENFNEETYGFGTILHMRNLAESGSGLWRYIRYLKGFSPFELSRRRVLGS